MENTTGSNRIVIEKKFQKLMDKILKSQNQVTKLMVSNAITAAELKMTYTPEFMSNLEAAKSNPDN